MINLSLTQSHVITYHGRGLFEKFYDRARMDRVETKPFLNLRCDVSLERRQSSA